jgi:hypothetical protein
MDSNLKSGNTITTICSNITGYVLFAGYNNTNNWPTYTPNQTPPPPPPINYNNVFNLNIQQQTSLQLQGSVVLGGNNFTINNSVYDGSNNTYICGGNFTISKTAPSAQNIIYLQGGTWFSLGLTFNNNSFVNCMTIFSSSTSSTSLLFIGGQFSTVTDVNNNNYNLTNFAVININSDNYTVNTSVPPPPPTFPTSSQINSLVFVETTLYVGGMDTNKNIYFCSYNRTSMEWTNLLTSSLSGSINILYYIPKTNPSDPDILAIGGQFTSIGTATNCNNIVLYNIGTGAWTPLGTEGNYGVTGIGTTSPPLPSSVVYTITSNFALNDYIYIGGYFVNAGDTKCNSLVMYDYKNIIWMQYNPTLTTIPSTNPGVLNDNSIPTSIPPINPTSTDPGIVYSLIINCSDYSNLLIGGSFYINTNLNIEKANYIYNLFKVTTNSQNLIYGAFWKKTINTPS